MVLRRPTGPSRTNTQKDILFIIGDWNAKVESQEIPGVTGKFGLGVQNEAGQRLIEFCQENALIIANTLFQQHKRRLYIWTLPDGQYKIRLIIFSAAKMEKLYTVSKNKTRSSGQPSPCAKTTSPWATGPEAYLPRACTPR